MIAACSHAHAKDVYLHGALSHSLKKDFLQVIFTCCMCDGKIQDYVAKIGKVSISCKDTPGFVVNRLLVPFIGQAIEMAHRGDATPQDIDTAMRLGTGHPMGPLHLSDYIGNDTILFVLDGWEKNFPDDPSFRVPENLREMVAAGNLGRKTGKVVHCLCIEHVNAFL